MRNFCVLVFPYPSTFGQQLLSLANELNSVVLSALNLQIVFRILIALTCFPTNLIHQQVVFLGKNGLAGRILNNFEKHLQTPNLHFLQRSYENLFLYALTLNFTLT